MDGPFENGLSLRLVAPRRLLGVSLPKACADFLGRRFGLCSAVSLFGLGVPQCRAIVRLQTSLGGRREGVPGICNAIGEVEGGGILNMKRGGISAAGKGFLLLRRELMLFCAI